MMSKLCSQTVSTVGVMGHFVLENLLKLLIYEDEVG